MLLRFVGSLLVVFVLGALYAYLLVPDDPGTPSMAGQIIPALIFAIPVLVILFGFWSYYVPRWYLQRGDVETGPFSICHLGRILRTNQIEKTDQIRKRWSKVVSPYHPHAPCPALVERDHRLRARHGGGLGHRHGDVWQSEIPHRYRLGSTRVAHSKARSESVQAMASRGHSSWIGGWQGELYPRRQGSWRRIGRGFESLR